MDAKGMPKAFWYISIGLIAVAVGGFVVYDSSQPSVVPNSEISAGFPQDIVALGRLEPASDVVNVAAPLALQGDRIAELRVNVGDFLQPGQVIAVLDSRDRLEKLLAQAQGQVQVTQSHLARVQAGAKRGEITAQQATTAQLKSELSGETSAQAAALVRLRAELDNAQNEFDRFNSLYQAGAVSASDLDAKGLALKSAQARLSEAKANEDWTGNTLQAQIRASQATLDGITEVRPEDIALAQAEVDQAKTALQVASTDLEKAFIRAPTAGQILEVLGRPGEQIGNQGIIKLGQTEQMVVVIEVDSSDINRVRIGQSATITSDAFEAELRGTIREIGYEVKRQSVFSDQPGADLDSRVIETRIELSSADSQRAANFTNLQVIAAIQTERSLNSR